MLFERVIVVTLFTCLSVCLSVTDLEVGRLLAFYQRDMNLNWTMIYIPLIFQFFEIRPCFRESEKIVPFERTLDHTHSFTNGKVSLHNTRIV